MYVCILQMYTRPILDLGRNSDSSLPLCKLVNFIILKLLTSASPALIQNVRMLDILSSSIIPFLRSPSTPLHAQQMHLNKCLDLITLHVTEHGTTSHLSLPPLYLIPLSPLTDASACVRDHASRCQHYNFTSWTL